MNFHNTLTPKPLMQKGFGRFLNNQIFYNNFMLQVYIPKILEKIRYIS
jgi:hypothetical protein